MIPKITPAYWTGVHFAPRGRRRRRRPGGFFEIIPKNAPGGVFEMGHPAPKWGGPGDPKWGRELHPQRISPFHSPLAAVGT